MAKWFNGPVTPEEALHGEVTLRGQSITDPSLALAVPGTTLTTVAGAVNAYVYGALSFTATLPALGGTLAATEGVPSGFAAILPALTGEVFFGAQIRATLPALRAVVTATVPAVLRFDVALPALQANVTASTGGVLQTSATLQPLTAEIFFGGQIKATLPALQASVSATAGGVLRANAVLPALQAEVHITTEATLRIDAVLPALRVISPLRINITLPALTAHVVMREVVAVTYEAYAINLTTGAVTHYTNYPFDNILRFGNKYYGIASGGIYELSGSLDLTVPIDAHIKTFETNFGDRNFKRIPYIYTAGRSDGGVTIGITADEGVTYSYDSQWGEVPGNTNHRSVVGRGLRGVYYSLEVSNINGGSLELDALAVPVMPTTRGV